jgi:hypothetical protein
VTAAGDPRPGDLEAHDPRPEDPRPEDPRPDDASPSRLARLAALRPALDRRDAGVLDHLHALAYADGWVVAGFDWVGWAATEEATALLTDPADASVAQIERLMTLVVRRDRFVEGSLVALLAAGWLAGLARRAAELAAAHGNEA